MVLHPGTMRRGQEELDSVLGKNALPTLDDKQNLPYVTAICKEVLRCAKTSLLPKWNSDATRPFVIADFSQSLP